MRSRAFRIATGSGLACASIALFACTLLHPLDGFGRCDDGACAGDSGAGDAAQQPPVIAATSCQLGGAGAAHDCADGTADCCETLCIEGGTFDRSNDPTALATLGPFCLDRFEVTVGRFRNFVSAIDAGNGTQLHPPAAGAGAVPNVPGTGWDPSDDSALAPDEATLLATIAQCNGTPAVAAWSDQSSTGLLRPMNCVDWYMAYAFCIWDGGRLETEAEWNFAAAAGAQQRNYPWGTQTIDPSYAAYDCTEGSWTGDPAGCSLSFLPPVGSYAKGDGFFGHADLVGSMDEWMLDWYGPYAVPCTPDCVNLMPDRSPGVRVERGDDWLHATFTNTVGRDFDVPSMIYAGKGIRCAR